MKRDGRRTAAGFQRFRSMPSSVIHDFDYDPASEELTIEFKTGRVYAYFAVHEEVFAAFSSAPSRGSYFNRHIRNHYDFREMTPAQDTR